MGSSSWTRGGWPAPDVGGDMMSRREGGSASGTMVVTVVW